MMMVCFFGELIIHSYLFRGKAKLPTFMATGQLLLSLITRFTTSF